MKHPFFQCRRCRQRPDSGVRLRAMVWLRHHGTPRRAPPITGRPGRRQPYSECLRIRL